MPESSQSGARNIRPQWLGDAHEALDAAVAAAYGWSAHIADDILRELLALERWWAVNKL